jgi:DNA replication protein DnaC
MKSTLEKNEVEKMTQAITEEIEKCPVCGEPLKIREGYTGSLVTAQCKCKREKAEAEARKKKLDALRSECFDYIKQHGETFETDAGYNPKLTQIAKNYVAKFEQFSRKGQGLLLYGSYGCGKTFASHQIANALIDKEHRVRVSTFEGLHALYRDGRSSGSFFKRLASYDLVVLDDLGAEHQKNQMRSFVFEIINTLYEARTPFIITTNLSS